MGRGADARIEVSVPRWTPDREVERFVRMKRSWIDKGIQDAKNSPMAQAEAATPAQVREWRAVVEACTPPLIAAWEPILGVKAKTLGTMLD